LEVATLSATGKILPQLVSEYGAAFSNKEVDGTTKYEPIHDWWILKGVVGKLMQFISRPDNILKASHQPIYSRNRHD